LYGGRRGELGHSSASSTHSIGYVELSTGIGGNIELESFILYIEL